MFKIGKGLLKRTTKCPYGFVCLTDERFMCPVEAVVDNADLAVEKNGYVSVIMLCTAAPARYVPVRYEMPSISATNDNHYY